MGSAWGEEGAEARAHRAGVADSSLLVQGTLSTSEGGTLHTVTGSFVSPDSALPRQSLSFGLEGPRPPPVF